MKSNSFIWIFVFLVLSISTYAAPPVTTIGSGLASGINIVTPKFEYVTMNQNYTFRAHVYNASNEVPLYTKPSCYLNIYNPTGKEILKTTTFTKILNEYDLTIDKSNQSSRGLYSYIAWCNSTAYQIGGFISGSYVVVDDTQVYRLLDNSPFYAITFMGFMFAVAFFLLAFSNMFKLEGDPWGITITKISVSVLLKLMSLATVVYSMFIFQTIIPTLNNESKIFSGYLTLFIYGIVIFFVLYFIHQFVVMATNYQIRKDSKPKRLGE